MSILLGFRGRGGSPGFSRGRRRIVGFLFTLDRITIKIYYLSENHVIN